MADEKREIDMTGIGGILGMGLDYATAGWQDKRARKMARFNQQLAIDTWEKTNVGRQRELMEQAGLNVGLMYKQGGAGGATSQGAQVQPLQGMGMQLGMQMAMQKAQIENIKADTQVKQVDAEQRKGPQTESILAGIENMRQATSNAKMQAEIMKYEMAIKEIEKNVASQTQESLIKQAGEQYKLIAEQVKQIEGTNPELIKQAKQTTIEQTIRMDLMRANILKTGVETQAQREAIKKTAAEIVRMQEQTAQGWKALSQTDQEQTFKQLETEFKYGNEWNFKVFMDQLEKIIPF